MNVPIKNPYTDASNGGESIAGAVRTGQIISFALVQGVILITAVMLFLVLRDGPGDELPAGAEAAASSTDWLLLGIGVAIALSAAVAAVVLWKLFLGRAVEEAAGTGELTTPVDPTAAQGPAGQRLIGAYRVATIVTQAVLEGAAMANAVLLLIDGSLWHLLPIALLLAGIALLTPTATRLEQLFDDAARGRGKRGTYR